MSFAPSRTVRMATLMLFFWAGIICVEGFMVPYLASIGFSERSAGLVMAAVYIISVFSTPMWGYIADRTDRHRRIITIGLLISVAAILGIRGSGSVFSLIVVFSLLYSLTAMSLPALIDSWIMRMNWSGAPINYGIARGVGSLGFALGSAVLGVIFDRHGLSLMFPSYAVLMLVVVAVATTLGTRRAPRDRPAESMAPVRGAEVLRAVLTNSRYLVLLIASFFVLLGTRAAVTFMPLRLYSLGGTVAHVGWFQSINAASEIPFMFLSALILRRVRPRGLILIGMLFFTLRLVLIRLAPTPGFLLAVQILQGPSFGFLLPAIVHYVDRIAPPHLQSLFQTLAPSVYFGLASVVGSAVGGAFIERYGMELFYTLTPAVAAVGAIVFAVSLIARRRGGEQSH